MLFGQVKELKKDTKSDGRGFIRRGMLSVHCKASARDEMWFQIVYLMKLLLLDPLWRIPVLTYICY